jgi:hypothetical protein
MNWLSKLDPNTVIPILSLLSAVGGWIWDRARGRTTQSFSSVIDSVIDNLINELLDHPPSDEMKLDGYLKMARGYIDSKIWTVLTKRGIPKNALTTRLLHSAIEAGTDRLGREVLERRKRNKEQGSTP